MILWLNGTFGAGKTTTARLLDERLERWRIFDPEYVGYMLQSQLQDQEFSDFQQLPPWRALVPRSIASVMELTGQQVIAPQSVLVEDYWRELMAGFAAEGLAVRHIVLDCDRVELAQRIEADELETSAREWRLEHLDRYETARPWMLDAADQVVDTTGRSPEQAAAAITAELG